MAILQTFQQKNIYKDFDLSFNVNPITGDIAVKTDANAINQSLRSLINTNFYERPFRPTVGSNIRNILFEPADSITIDDLRQAIRDTVTNHEPRVDLIQVQVEDNSDRNAYTVNIVYRIVNSEVQNLLTVILERLR